MIIVIIIYLVFWFAMILTSIVIAEEYKEMVGKRRIVKWGLMGPIPAIIYYIIDLYFIQEE